ncbi:hypothetical protein [Micromonospora sp. NPDC049374]|uniref:hypothetical protein n=1 Tax=Micromonospora sp. NPDC049374 TaxID=3154352 RepID=UPI003424F387
MLAFRLDHNVAVSAGSTDVPAVPSIVPVLVEEGDIGAGDGQTGAASDGVRHDRPDTMRVEFDQREVASRKVIERSGGVLQDRYEAKRRYWVPTA